MYSAETAMVSSSVHTAPPTVIGRYRILTRIASGGMGAVYLAEVDEAPDVPPQRVALKVLHAHHGDDDEIMSRFVDEGRVAGRILHPNVVQVLDAGRVDEYAYMALEYVHGDTLSGLLRACAARGIEFPLRIAAAIAIDFLEGLHAAHQSVDEAGASLGLVHRDVSPQNILVGVNGRAYVTDFGVAKVKDRIRATRSGSMIGKTGYMAPEQIAGGVVSAKTDLYAAGIVLWECLAGAKLFDGLEAQIQAAVTRKPPPAVRTRRTDVPEGIDELVRDLLQHAPDRRPQSAHLVAERIAAALPRASTEEVAAWVSALVAPKLEERERRVAASLHAAHEGLYNEQTREPSAAAALARTHHSETSGGDAVAATVLSSNRRTGAAAAIAGGLVVATVFSIVGLSQTSTHTAVLSLMRSKSLARAAVTEPIDLGPVPVESLPPVASATARTTPAKPTQHLGALPATAGTKTSKSASGGACSPPYVVQNGIKRYKAECFGGGK